MPPLIGPAYTFFLCVCPAVLEKSFRDFFRDILERYLAIVFSFHKRVWCQSDQLHQEGYWSG